MPSNWQKLRTKLLILFMCLMFIPICGIGIYNHLFLEQGMVQQVIALNEQQLHTEANRVETIFTEAQNTLQYISNMRALNVLKNSSPQTELYDSSLQVLMRDLVSYAEIYPIYHQIAVFNAIGEPVLLIENDLEAVKVLDSIIGMQFANFIQDILLTPVDTLHLTIDDNTDATTSRIILALRASESIVLVSIWSEDVLKPSNNAMSGTWSLQLPIQAMLHFADPDSMTRRPDLTIEDSWLTAQSGFYNDGNQTVLFEHKEIPTLQNTYDLVLFYSISNKHLQADLSSFYRSYTVLIIGVLLSVIALLLFAIDRFITPIEQLKEAIDSIRKTEKVPRLPDQLPPDEIGELSLAFYTMATELAQKRQSERALVDKLITAQEEERKRIAYELHDGLIQQLVGARLQLNQCRSMIVEQSVYTTYEVGYEALSTAIVEGRRIMQGLHPSILDDLGIVEALRELCNMMVMRTDWELTITLEALTTEPDKITSVTLYRIAQEALNNILKHATAHNVQVTLWQDENYHLVIKDDGCGFNTSPLPKPNGGWGLRTMTERVDLLYGKINIDSSISGGTTIEVCLPVKQNQGGNIQ